MDLIYSFSNGIDQLRQMTWSSPTPSTDPDINSTHYQLTQSQGSGSMTLLSKMIFPTPTGTSGVS